MTRLALLCGLTIAGGLAFGVAGTATAAPGQSTLPMLEALRDGEAITQVRRRCRSICIRKRMGICTKWRNRCWSR
jgi:hypothetical protein